MDVIDSGFSEATRGRDEAVADFYKGYLEMTLRIAEPSVVVFWILSDRRNWVDWAAKSNPNHRRADGMPHRPGLRDSDLHDKPAYAAVREALCP